MKTEFAAMWVALGLALAPVVGYTADSMSKDPAPTKKESAKETVKETKETVKENVSDAAITTKIKADYAKDKDVSAMKIHVDTDNKGVVKLTGTAKSKAEADKAESIAKSVKGVTSVKNEIKVGADKK
jgi:hyperosmotically inducible protein